MLFMNIPIFWQCSQFVLIRSALFDLGLEFPCSENRGEEGDERLYRLAHDEARAARSAFRPGRLLLLTSLGEAREVSPRRGLRL